MMRVPHPDTNCAVITCGSQALAVTAEGHAPDLSLVSSDNAQDFAAVGVPHFDPVFRPFPDEVTSRGIVRHEKEDSFRGRRKNVLTSHHLPYPDRGYPIPIDGGSCDASAIRAKRHSEEAPNVFGSQGMQESASASVPDAQHSAPSSAGQKLAIGAVINTPNFMFVLSRQRFQPFVALQWGCVPEANRAVSTTGCEFLAVGTKRQAVPRNRVASEVQDFSTARRVPHFHKFVFGSTGEETPAILAAGKPRYHSGMPSQCLQQFACCRFPNLHGPVKASGRQPLAVGMKNDRADSVRMRIGFADEFARPTVPDSQHSSPASGGQEPAVGAERRACLRSLVLLLKTVPLLAIPRIPSRRDTGVAASYEQLAIRAERDSVSHARVVA